MVYLNIKEFENKSIISNIKEVVRLGLVCGDGRELIAVKDREPPHSINSSFAVLKKNIKLNERHAIKVVGNLN